MGGEKLMSNGIFAFAKYVNSRYAHYHFLHVRYVFHGLGNLWPFVIYEPPYASPPKTESLTFLPQIHIQAVTKKCHSKCKLISNFLRPFSNNISLFLCRIWLAARSKMNWPLKVTKFGLHFYAMMWISKNCPLNHRMRTMHFRTKKPFFESNVLDLGRLSRQKRCHQS